MSVIVGGSNGVTYNDSSNTPAADVTEVLGPKITDTANVMRLNSGTSITGSKGITLSTDPLWEQNTRGLKTSLVYEAGDALNLSSYTFSATNLGPAGVNRQIVAFVHGGGKSTGRYCTALSTPFGAATNVAADQGWEQDVSVWYINTSSATTSGNFVTTQNSTFSDCYIYIYVVINYTTAPAVEKKLYNGGVTYYTYSPNVLNWNSGGALLVSSGWRGSSYNIDTYFSTLLDVYSANQIYKLSDVANESSHYNACIVSGTGRNSSNYYGGLKTPIPAGTGPGFYTTHTPTALNSCFAAIYVS